MDGHLVAVEIRIERRAYERMQPDRFPFDEDREKGLYSQTVQRGRTI